MWIRIAFVNLLIVALLGVTMRYKIAYYLPFIEQKNFLHAHSHFAFSGWVTHLLLVLMWRFLAGHLPPETLRKYKWIVITNLVASYGMLFTFPWEGYGIISIFFSTVTILVAYVFAFVFWRDLNKIKLKTVTSYWFKGAVLFGVLSSFGAFSLSYMMATNTVHPDRYLASTYYFLHFQYNGWFFFACMGLFSDWFIKTTGHFPFRKRIFWLFALSCVPAYFLSALWLPIGNWVYAIVAVAATAQVVGWGFFLRAVYRLRNAWLTGMAPINRWMLILAATALSIKFFLQLGSVIPFLSKLAFGFRPVVIGYLHLMFLGFVTVFLIAYCRINNIIINGKRGNIGILILIAGIILNELFLMIQGLSYMNYLVVPGMNQLLLAAALTLFLGILLLVTNLVKNPTQVLKT